MGLSGLGEVGGKQESIWAVIKGWGCLAGPVACSFNSAVSGKIVEEIPEPLQPPQSITNASAARLKTHVNRMMREEEKK